MHELESDIADTMSLQVALDERDHGFLQDLAGFQNHPGNSAKTPPLHPQSVYPRGPIIHTDALSKTTKVLAFLAALNKNGIHPYLLGFFCFIFGLFLDFFFISLAYICFFYVG